MFNKALLMAYGKVVDDPRYTLSFVASKDGGGINFFSDVSSTRHPDDAFTVKINGKKTDQNYCSLSFASGDEVVITCDKEFSFPTFVASNNNYFSTVSPLPFMTDRYGAAKKNAGSMFKNCSDLTSVPENLFANNTEISGFNNSFSYCSGLTTIPENLFANNTKATTFEYTLSSCSNLTSVPENLFANNTEVTEFYGTFAGCTGLTSVPENLFANNTKATNFTYLFNVCSNLTSVPENLFANNTEATNFTVKK